MTHIQDQFPRLKKALEEISASGDSARLQLHLLSMQAKERGEDLSANLLALEQKVDKGVERALNSATDATRQLNEVVRTFLGEKAHSKGNATTARSIMTGNVSSCGASEPLSRAAQVMWEHDCGCVPIIDADGRLIGIVTDRDLCMAAYTTGARLEEIRIGDIMVRSVHGCQPDDSISRIMTLMAEGQVRRLPVLDNEDRLLGVVSLADIARNIGALGEQDAEPLVLELLRAISKQRDHYVVQDQAAE